ASPGLAGACEASRVSWDRAIADQCTAASALEWHRSRQQPGVERLRPGVGITAALLDQPRVRGLRGRNTGLVHVDREPMQDRDVAVAVVADRLALGEVARLDSNRHLP